MQQFQEAHPRSVNLLQAGTSAAAWQQQPQQQGQQAQQQQAQQQGLQQGLHQGAVVPAGGQYDAPPSKRQCCDGPPAEDSPINIVVKDQSGHEVYFKLKYSTPLRKVMLAFCDKRGIAVDDLRLLYYGYSIDAREHTPLSLGMEDGDVLDAMRILCGD
jgi:hypothetical protein